MPYNAVSEEYNLWQSIDAWFAIAVSFHVPHVNYYNNFASFFHNNAVLRWKCPLEEIQISIEKRMNKRGRQRRVISELLMHHYAEGNQFKILSLKTARNAYNSSENLTV